MNNAVKTTEAAGLDFWMENAIREWERARVNLKADSVHDLRVALRRCRSMADGFMAFDPHPAWKQMRNEGRRLFRQLGTLRDTQIMMDWVQRLAPSADKAYFALIHHLAAEEHRFKESASEAMGNFSPKKWVSWARVLSQRAHRIMPESLVFQHLALERWLEAREMHHRALRDRSRIAYHRLRIGLKRLRYTVENFLPSLHQLWGQDLKELQDLLGEIHDLDVLWHTALSIKALSDEKTRLEWRQKIAGERSRRLERYRSKMLGKASLWFAWRAQLPAGDQIKDAAMAWIRAWARFRDPDFAHSEHVANLATQLYENLRALGLIPADIRGDAPVVLEVAALAHDVGISSGRKKHERNSYRLIRKLRPPLGLNADSLRRAALIARFHRGPLPRPNQKAFAGMPGNMIKDIMLLGGILRLANAFDSSHQRQIRRLELKRDGNVLVLMAPGYSELDPAAEKLAAARHLLEIACGIPILIRQILSQKGS